MRKLFQPSWRGAAFVLEVSRFTQGGVSTANALLTHCSRSPGLHPEVMFQQMLAAAGGLMTFSDRYKTADLPAYRHEALGEVFAQLDALLRDLVDTVIGSKYFTILLLAVTCAIASVCVTREGRWR